MLIYILTFRTVHVDSVIRTTISDRLNIFENTADKSRKRDRRFRELPLNRF